MHTVSTEAAPDVTLREVQPGDIDLCAQIVFDAFGGIHDHHRFTRDFPALEAAKGLMSMWIPHRAIWGVVAEVDGRIVGQLGVSGEGRMEIGMWVAPEWRGKGVGTALMNAALDYARTHGAYKISLEVWPHNAAAIALYEKFGFEREGYLRKHWRRRNGELWDSVVMGLVLDE